MKRERARTWLLVAALCISSALCVWAWLFNLFMLLWLTALPGFFLQALICRGRQEWKWLRIVAPVLIVGALSIGVLIMVLGENWAPLAGMILAVSSASALAGCLLAWLLCWVSHRKRGKR